MSEHILDLHEPIELVYFTNACKLAMQTKLSRGEEMIDLRVWSKWNIDQQWHPGKNGLFVEKSKFLNDVLPKLIMLLKKNNGPE